MTSEQLKEYLHEKGYSLHYTHGSLDSQGTIRSDTCWTKYYDTTGKPCAIENCFFSISLILVDLQFELLFVTERRMFKFRSGRMSPVTRRDFDKIESDFVHYAYQLQLNPPWTL